LSRADRATHRVGVALVAGSAVAWSTAGFFTRLIAVDTWTLLFWRGVFGGLFLAAVVVVQEGRHSLRAIRSMGMAGWWVAGLSTIAMVSYLNALRLTAVADVMIVYATVPFIVAALAWLVMRERASRPTLVASAGAAVGVVVMLGGAPLVGNPWGDVLAFVMTLTYGAVLVVLRRHRHVAMIPAACVSAALVAAVSWPLAAPTAVGSRDFVYLVLFGVAQMGLGLLLLTLGSRLIPAAETALIGTLDTPLSPFWVWLAFGEVPTVPSLVGGTLVLAAVVGHIVAESRRSEGRRVATR
jgi:drug/metabolite transporter (DMT)-like permease